MRGQTSWINSSSKRQRYIRNNNNDDKKANSKIAYLFCLKKIEKKKKKTEDKCGEMLNSWFLNDGIMGDFYFILSLYVEAELTFSF